jgi:hypothetical protein
MTEQQENEMTTETSRMDALPESFEGARDQLAIEGGITNSSEWRRAAIVYALTEPKQGQRTDLTSSNVGRSFSVVGKISFQALADWKVIGLRKRQHVSAYWHFWQAAIDAELAEPIELGDPYVEPDMEWPGFRHYKGDPDKPEDDTEDDPFTRIAKLWKTATEAQLKANETAFASRDIINTLDKDERESLLGAFFDGFGAATRSLEIVVQKLQEALTADIDGGLARLDSYDAAHRDIYEAAFGPAVPAQHHGLKPCWFL